MPDENFNLNTAPVTPSQPATLPQNPLNTGNGMAQSTPAPAPVIQLDNAQPKIETPVTPMTETPIQVEDNSKRGKTYIIIAVAAIAVAVGGYILYKTVFGQTAEVPEGKTEIPQDETTNTLSNPAKPDTTVTPDTTVPADTTEPSDKMKELDKVVDDLETTYDKNQQTYEDAILEEMPKTDADSTTPPVLKAKEEEKILR